MQSQRKTATRKKFKPNAIVDQETKNIIVQKRMPNFNILTFEGGGIACKAYAEAARVMYECGVLDEVEIVAGVSGGSIAGFGVAIGCDSEQISNIMSSMPTEKFLEGTESWKHTPSLLAWVRKLHTVWRDGGLSDGKALETWLKATVKEYLGDENFTLRDLDNKVAEEKAKNNGVSKYKKLMIGVTDINLPLPEAIVYSGDSEEQYPIWFLLFASSLYPFFFKPVKRDEHLFSDGAIRQIILSRIFDDRKYIQEGYDFTDLGKNPGLLEVRAETDAEIELIYWGIKKRIKKDTPGDQLKRVTNAALETTDFDEMRFARHIIPLSDVGIDRLDMKVSSEKLSELYQKAFVTTKEFFEDHIYGAYEVESFSGVAEWLDSRETDDVIAIKNTYIEMQNELKTSVQEVAKRDALIEFDPARPSLSQLEKAVHFLDEYLMVRCGKIGIEDCEIAALKQHLEMVREKAKKDAAMAVCIPQIEDMVAAQIAAIEDRRRHPDLYYPKNHINIDPEFPVSRWHSMLKTELMEKLDNLDLKIKVNENEFQDYVKELGTCIEQTEDPDSDKQLKEPFCGYQDERVQVLVSYDEHLNKLCKERNAIALKLGIKPVYHSPQHCDDSREYAFLNEKIAALRDAIYVPALSASLRAVIRTFQSVIDFDVNKAHRIDFKLDMLDARNRKLFLIAGMLYLEQRSCPDKDRLGDIYDAFFPDEDTPPANVADLKRFMGQDGPDLQISLLKLESLLQYFEKKENPNPKLIPAMNIGRVLKVSDFSIFAKQKQANEEQLLPEKTVSNDEINLLPAVMNDGSSAVVSQAVWP